MMGMSIHENPRPTREGCSICEGEKVPPESALPGVFCYKEQIVVKLMQVTLWIYAVALRRSWECVLRNWVVSFAPLVYGIGLSLVGFLVAPLGIVGGILMMLATQACVSS